MEISMTNDSRETRFAVALAMLFLTVAGTPMRAQTARESDTIQTSKGALKITPIMHASLMMEFDGKIIHVDPWSEGNYQGLPQADVIIITDVHPDHQDRAQIDKLKKVGTVVIAPKAVAATITEAQIISNVEKKTLGGLQVEAVPMYNLQRGPEPGTLFHDKGRGNGYILTLGGKRIYIAGDTECIPEMKALKNIDVAFIPMNLPYTMPPAEAADCVKAFQPKIVYPYHFRGSDPQEFANTLKGTPEVEVRIRKWY
jgi:L-ascorbate metabolism protein UlaG (beta-lactamase superfamily)